jgi:hypothetical protein
VAATRESELSHVGQIRPARPGATMSSGLDHPPRPRFLDCGSLAVARASAAEIIGIPEHDLRSRLGKGDELELPGPAPEFFVRWFHATRVQDPNDFLVQGILPTSTVRPRLQELLRTLARGLRRQGHYLNAGSLGMKIALRDEGPCAFLVRKGAWANHQYLEAPELVEDLAGLMLGANYEQLVDRFKSVTVPCIVTFRRPGGPSDLGGALEYLRRVELGSSEVEAAESPTRCFNGGGVPIPAEDIVSVDRL